MKIDKLSHSMIEDFLHCPFLFKTYYGGKGGEKPQQDNQPKYAGVQRVGEAVHKSFKEYFEGSRTKSFKIVTEIVRDPVLVQEAVNFLSYLAEAIDCYKPFVCEKELWYVPQDISLPQLYTRLDFLSTVNDKLRMIELKTGWNLHGQKEIEQTVEARMYRYMTDKIFGVGKVQLTYYYLRHDTIVNVDPEPIDEGFLLHVYKMMTEAESYNPNPSHCPRCNMIGTCKAPMVPTSSDIQEVALMYLHHDAKAKAYRELLKEYCKNEPLDVGHWRFHLVPVASYKVQNYKGFWKFLKEKGIFVGPDMRYLHRKCSNELRQAEERGLLQATFYTRFSADYS